MKALLVIGTVFTILLQTAATYHFYLCGIIDWFKRYDAGHVERMVDDKLAKTADVQKVEGKGGEDKYDGRRDLEKVGV